MSVPDCITPIVAYRLWVWDVAGLSSLNGVSWIAGQPLAAECKPPRRGTTACSTKQFPHAAPHTDCRCGVYASKRLESLSMSWPWRSVCVRGETWLWGMVVEHEYGWRAQFAYPKTLHVPKSILPITQEQMRSRLKSLAAYRCDVFVRHNGVDIPIWRKDSGFDSAGADFLTNWCRRWYERSGVLTRGDCLTIRGRGTVVVEHSDDTQVHAALGNGERLLLLRKNVTWNEANRRWESNGSVFKIFEC